MKLVLGIKPYRKEPIGKNLPCAICDALRDLVPFA